MRGSSPPDRSGRSFVVIKPQAVRGEVSIVSEEAPVLAGICRVTLPVSEVARSAHWDRTRLGYRVRFELIDDGQVTGAHLSHPQGGPELALRLDPEGAAMAARFDSFVIAVPDRQAIEGLARHLSALGQSHGGVHLSANGWVLPLLHDPDGRELRLCTLALASDTALADSQTNAAPQRSDLRVYAG